MTSWLKKALWRYIQSLEIPTEPPPRNQLRFEYSKKWRE